jgi:hypothetical protein
MSRTLFLSKAKEATMRLIRNELTGQLLPHPDPTPDAPQNIYLPGPADTVWEYDLVTGRVIGVVYDPTAPQRK